MGSRPGSISQPTLAAPLIPTEHIGPKGWIRYLYLFELPENYDAARVEQLLRDAFIAAKKRTPLLGCEAVPDLKTGLLTLREYGDEINDFKAKDLRAPGLFPSFAELQAKNFPVSALEADDVCYRSSEWPEAGDRLPVTLMQANFINGGLILNWCIFHAYSDGTTAYKFTEILAEDVRRLQGIKITNPCEIPYEDRAKIMRSSGRKPGKPEDHPEYVALPFVPEGPPPKLLERNTIKGQVFYFSPESMAALKKDSTDENSGEWISTNDAVAGLVWRTVMNAQMPVESLNGEAQQALFTVATDTRRRAHAPMHKQTIGNFVGFADARMDLKRLLTEATLAETAREVRRSITRSDKDYLDSLTALIENTENIYGLAPTVFLDMPGPNILYTTWRNFTLYDLQWGSALGNQMRSMRLPQAGMCNGAQIVFPEHKDGGLEMYVGVEKQNFERLCQDPLWRKYAEIRE
ncbi:uncharacterized protein K452DRAFT_232154 [Aplosporella prunicola CBS 121167]|uniref:Trichothecene 3-O-acetyltransferase n=1 Tax=Aplosporella prunicola CBS 121167 TaxID=1176127 RepID=A0A6A6B644_9PEZI|nr:uncharacterized protein K452DRAFT_232154 [Aplosporella prunicola CBS 121167]KAF2139480.1 hypothetical protein K452DRAFT_232154 [Aplosporella prunicola CBS 121167]